MIHIGAIFRKVRLNLELKQVDVANRAGLNRTYLNRIEMGKILHPTLKILDRIAKALRLPLSYLIHLWEGANESSLSK